MPTRLIASSFALIAFATAVLAGLVAEHAATTVLVRALLAMIVCYFVGLAVAAVALRAVQEHIDRYKQAHPLEPEAPAEAAEGEAVDAGAAASGVTASTPSSASSSTSSTSTSSRPGAPSASAEAAGPIESPQSAT